MCGTIDPGHPYDDYIVLLAKLGTTPHSGWAQRRWEAAALLGQLSWPDPP
jgi:hypothetical protein